ncbi:unnamed protein product [Rangifer tarandus platyrhynchus]|uniref:Uncharacterized protein n=1 Tax=Rangifer tarandus platyrhynchus TaxID=3082113 RepID=A0AC59Z5V6_RANTA
MKDERLAEALDRGLSGISSVLTEVFNYDGRQERPKVCSDMSDESYWKQYGSGLPVPPPGDLPNLEIEPALAGRFSTTVPPTQFTTGSVEGLTCSVRDLQSWQAKSWHVGSSSLTGDRTWSPLYWERGVLASGPPGKSLWPPIPSQHRAWHL